MNLLEWLLQQAAGQEHVYYDLRHKCRCEKTAGLHAVADTNLSGVSVPWSAL